MRKLTEKQKSEKVIGHIIARIKTIEKDYGLYHTRIACTRYSQASLKKARLHWEIKEKEKELAELKKRGR
jgi:hypothetical protein